MMSDWFRAQSTPVELPPRPYDSDDVGAIAQIVELVITHEIDLGTLADAVGAALLARDVKDPSESRREAR